MYMRLREKTGPWKRLYQHEISQKAKRVHRWIERIVKENLPFCFCESELINSLKHQFWDHIEKFARSLYWFISLSCWNKNCMWIAKNPRNYNWWLDTPEHTFSFNFCTLSQRKISLVEPLLFVPPLIIEAAVSATSHVAFIEGTLRVYQNALSSVLFLVADNGLLCKRIAKDMRFRMIASSWFLTQILVSWIQSNPISRNLYLSAKHCQNPNAIQQKPGLISTPLWKLTKLWDIALLQIPKMLIKNSEILKMEQLNSLTKKN